MENRIGFLAFEVSGSGRGWYKHFDMVRIIDLLDAYGYNCYVDSGEIMEPHDKLPFLTGCKQKRYSQSYANKKTAPLPYLAARGMIPQWGNVVCGLRKNNEIRKILAKLHTCGQSCIKLNTVQRETLSETLKPTNP